MAKKKNKVIEAEAVVKEAADAPEEKEVRDLSEVPMTDAMKALEEFNSAPNAEDLLFKNMSKENRKRHGLSLSTEQLEEKQIGSRHSMNESRVDYAIASSRLVARQAWREPDKDGKIYARMDYFERKLNDSWFTVERHHKAVLCLSIMGRDPSDIKLYRFRRLAAFYDKIEKNVATQKDFDDLEPKMVESPESANDILTDKEFDNEMKQRFGQREAEMKALQEEDKGDPTTRVTFEIPASQEKTVREAHRLGMDLATEENREKPGLGNVIVEALSHYMIEFGQGKKIMAAEKARQLFQETYGIALIPFKIHKFQKSPHLDKLPHMRIFQVGDYFMLEEEPRHVAKKLGVKVEQIKEVHVNVGAYLLRTGAMTIDDEDIKKAEEVLTKKFEGAKKAKKSDTKKKPAKKTTKKKTSKAKKDDEPKEDKPAKKKKSKKISELTDNEVSVSITKIKKDLGISEDEYKELADGKDPRKVLRELVKMQKASA